MATNRVMVPGLKASAGTKSFDPLSPGEYTGVVRKLEIKDPKNMSPTDVWTFELEILSGPPQMDGKTAKGRKAWHRVNIFREEHPSYKAEWSDPKSGQTQMGVDELKSMVIAFGVEIKGDSLNPDSFIGLEAGFEVVQTTDKESGKIYSNCKNFHAA